MEWYSSQAIYISEVLPVLLPLVKFFFFNVKANASLRSQGSATLACPLPLPTLLCSDSDSSAEFPLGLKPENQLRRKCQIRNKFDILKVISSLLL